jgi:hypothetical protein
MFNIKDAKITKMVLFWKKVLLCSAILGAVVQAGLPLEISAAVSDIPYIKPGLLLDYREIRLTNNIYEINYVLQNSALRNIKITGRYRYFYGREVYQPTDLAVLKKMRVLVNGVKIKEMQPAAKISRAFLTNPCQCFVNGREVNPETYGVKFTVVLPAKKKTMIRINFQK